MRAAQQLPAQESTPSQCDPLKPPSDCMHSICKATHQMELSYPVSVCTVTCTVPSPFWEADCTTP